MLDVGVIVVVVLAAVVAWFILKRGATPTSTAVDREKPPAVALPRDVQNDLRTMAARGNSAEAVRALRKQFGMAESTATAVVHGLLAGEVFPTEAAPEPEHHATRTAHGGKRAPIDGELMGMLKDLVRQDPDHRTAAILLLRQRTGMSDRDARKFINAL